MSEKDRLEAFFKANKGERFTTNELAEILDTDTDKARRLADSLHEDGKISKTKGGRIIAHNIHGDIIVLESNEEKLIEIIKEYAPSKLSKAPRGSTKRLRRFIERELPISEGFPVGKRNVYFMPP